MKEVVKGPSGRLRVETVQGSTVQDVDCLLWAVGTSPATTDLGLQDAGVHMDDKGRVKVDEFQNTSAEKVYALGDVTGKWELTPGKIVVLDRKMPGITMAVLKMAKRAFRKLSWKKGLQTLLTLCSSRCTLDF